MGETIGIGIVGFGKIARDQHVAAIRNSERFSLLSIADPAAQVDTVVSASRYASIEPMLASADAPAAVAICTPPQLRYGVARYALSRGKHVLLEKPPATTLEELEDLLAVAGRAGVSLFCAWHSQFAPAVAPARAWLADKQLRHVRIDWREDVRVWHAGQRWLWEPGGFGVFDPGINAISIATSILPKALLLRDAVLHVPENCATPLAASLALADVDGTPISASFDFLTTGPPVWDIEVATATGGLRISQGGARLALDEREVQLASRGEYPALYAHFADLIATGRSDVDARPLQLATAALQRGRREAAPPFVDPTAA